VDGNAGDAVAAELDLASVKADPYLKAERRNGVAHRTSGLDCSPGSVEDGEEAITGGVDLPTAEAFQLATDGRVVSVEDVAPSSVA
jgi:hypothetical protein